MRVDKNIEPLGRDFTRGDFLKRSVAAGAGLAGLPALLAACRRRTDQRRCPGRRESGS